MKIRAITYFCDPNWPLDEKKVRQAGAFLSESRTAFETEGYEVQTTRLATIPFPRLLGEKRINQTTRLAQELSQAAAEQGVDYISLGPALPGLPESYSVIPEAIASSKNTFFSGVMATAANGIDMDALHACASIITQVATLQPDGFANLNFAALAHVPAGAPFFPAAYHEGGEPVFSLAMEAADVALQAFEIARTLEDGRQVFVDILEENAHHLTRVADFLKFKHQVRFGGLDFSLAPFPESSRSLGAAVERLGVPRVGLHGSLAAAALLTEAIERAKFPRAGFCGFMQPVLEDNILALRAAEGTLTIKDLLLYSAVCGTGLDTVPLPGNVTADQVAALLLDISCLALRLNKPLTARLLPIPGKQAGDETDFHFGFFANSRVMDLQSERLRKPLASAGTITLNPRPG